MNSTNVYYIGCIAYNFLWRNGWHPEDAEAEVLHVLSLMSLEDLKDRKKFLLKYNRIGRPGYIRCWGEKVWINNRLEKAKIYNTFLNAGNHADFATWRSLRFNQFAIAYLVNVRPFELYQGIADAI